VGLVLAMPAQIAGAETGLSPTTPIPRSTLPYSIAAGPDGALWFTNSGNNSIGRITTAEVVTNYTDPTIDVPEGITAGLDGALWFTNEGNKSIGQITTPLGPCTAGLHAHVLSATYAKGTFTGLFCANAKGFGTYTQGILTGFGSVTTVKGTTVIGALGKNLLLAGSTSGTKSSFVELAPTPIKFGTCHIQLGATRLGVRASPRAGLPPGDRPPRLLGPFHRHLSAEICARTRPFQSQVALLASITGVSATTAQVIVAEAGADMSRFPDPPTISAPGRNGPGQLRVSRVARPVDNLTSSSRQPMPSPSAPTRRYGLGISQNAPSVRVEKSQKQLTSIRRRTR
jgi:hypothetical protein